MFPVPPARACSRSIPAFVATVPVAPSRAFATATGAQRFQPSAFGPAIHSDPSTVPGRVEGVLTVEDFATVGAFPIVVVFVVVVEPPVFTVELLMVTPVLLLTVLVVVVVLGADVIAQPLRR